MDQLYIETSAAPLALDDIRRRIIEIFRSVTGYSHEVLSLDADLDGDLGIDSITAISIFDEVCGAFGIDIAELGGQQLSTIDAIIKKVSELVDSGRQGGPPAALIAERHQGGAPRDLTASRGPLLAEGSDARSSTLARSSPEGALSRTAEGLGEADRAMSLGLLPSGIDPNRTFLSQGTSQKEQHEILDRVATKLGGVRSIHLDDCDTPSKIATFVEACRLREVERLSHAQPRRSNVASGPVTDQRTMADFYEVRNRDLFTKVKRFNAFLKEKQKEDLYWYGMPLMTPCANRVVLYDALAGRPREFLMMGSNNYLGLANHPRVIEAIRDAAGRFGSTNTGCRLIGGTNQLHLELERRIARFKNCEAAIVFPSGYSANVGTISALARRHDCVLSDKLNHMSILDGCKLSGASTRIYGHNDMDDLERILERCDGEFGGKLIATDGVFSMHGDICDLPGIARLARKYGAKLLVDDAHATGVLGRTGAGTSEHFEMKGEVDLELGTFSKTLAGVGGFVCGAEEVIEYLRFYANSYVFAATIPAAVAAGLIASLDVLESEPARIERLWKNIAYFKQGLIQRGFDVGDTRSAIIPVVIGNDALTLKLGRAVRARSLFCQTVVYPGVSRGEERLRISLSSEHTLEDLDLALDILVDSALDVGLPIQKRSS